MKKNMIQTTTFSVVRAKLVFPDITALLLSQQLFISHYSLDYKMSFICLYIIDVFYLLGIF